MPVTTDAIDRTVQIWTPDNKGTGAGFTFRRHDREWLVTAAHVVRGYDPSQIKVVTREGQLYHGLEHVPADPGVDIAVFSQYKKQITPNMRLEPTTEGVALGQDVYFLGFPLGWSVQNGNLRMPFTKRATVSGSTVTDTGKLVWVLDGMNMDGFSGGPIVFKNIATQVWDVLGVVHGYQKMPVLVHDVRGDAIGQAQTNSGYFIGFDIKYATEAIDAFVNNAAA